MGEHSLIKKKNNWPLIVFAAAVFAGLYIFLTRAHPLYIHDLDDWFYLYFSREALPSAQEMNPIKVLPETWMPMVSYLGAYLIYPITGDYTGSLAMAYGVVLALMITAYTLGAVAVLARRYEIKSPVSRICLGVIFLLAHFWVLILEKDNNRHLFYAANVTCVFNYTLPALLNLTLCTYFFDQNQRWKPLSPGKLGLLLLGVYLAIFSSLFHSIVLMSLFGIQLLYALIQGVWENVRNQKPWLSWPYIREYVTVHYPKLIALAVWFVSMAFQMGGRGEDMSGPFQLKNILWAFYEMLRWGLNPQFKTAVILINLSALVVAVYRWRKHRETKFLVQQLEILGCLGLIIVYLLLVTGRLSTGYFTRPDVAINWLSLVIFMSVASLAYLIKQVPKMAAVLPLVVYLLLFTTVFNDITYRDYNVSGLSPSVVKAVNEDVISQIKAAEEQGLTEVEVYVPESLADGWPLDTRLMNSRFSRPLWYHKVTDYRVFVTVVPSPEKDIQFHLSK